MKATTRILSAATIVLLLASTAACGGDDPSTTTSGATTLGVKNTTITVAAAGASAVPGTDGQALSQGETLTTDGTGFGIVNYPDKSLTRLDKNAVFTLDSVGTSATQPQVKATLKQGQAWNRVQKITGTDGQYEITTPFGTVAVRGTTFNIDCTTPPGACTITVIEGTVDITPTGGTADTLTAPAQTVLTASAVSPPTPIPPTFTTSAWAGTNTGLDAAAVKATSGGTTPTTSTAPAPGDLNAAAAAYLACRQPVYDENVRTGRGKPTNDDTLYITSIPVRDTGIKCLQAANWPASVTPGITALVAAEREQLAQEKAWDAGTDRTVPLGIGGRLYAAETQIRGVLGLPPPPT